MHFTTPWTSTFFVVLTEQPHPVVFSIILKAQINIALHQAAGSSRPAIIRRLLVAGADKGVKDKDGKTALNMAREWGKQECVALLT